MSESPIRVLIPLPQREEDVLDRALVGLIRLADAVSRAQALPEIMEEALTALERSLQPDRASVLLLEPDGVMRFRAWRRLSDGYRAAVEGHSPWPPDAVDPEPVLVPDVREDAALAPLREVLEREGLRALAFIPLTSAGKLLGKFMLYYDAPHTFTEREVLLARTIAAHIGFAVERRRNEERLALYQQVFVNSVEATAIIDPQGRYLEQNAAHHALIGYDDAELRNCTPAVHLGDACYGQVVDGLVREGRFLGEVTSHTRRGEELRLELSAFIVRDAAGQPLCYVGTKRDITQQRRAQDRLRVLAEATQQLSDSLELKVVTRNAARVAVPSFAHLSLVDLGNEAGELERAAWAAADPETERWVSALAGAGRPPDDPAVRAWRTASVVDASGSTAPLFVAPLEVRQSSSAPRWPWVLSVPLAAHQQVLGVITFARSARGPAFDAEDHRMAEELARRIAVAVENARLYRDLQDAVRARDEFLSIASHELRTPLTSLQLQIDSARGLFGPVDKPPVNTDEKLASAGRQVRRLGKLVDELLDVSRISAGRLKLEPERVDLAALTDEVVRRFEPEFARAECTLQLATTGNAEGMWDRLRLEQILSNLLSNALKYGAGKPIDVEVHGDGDAVRWVVRDRGIGIAPEHQARIFERFERMVSTRHFGGLGLGLWIVRQIVEAHAGSIRVESRLHEGSTFVVRLPRHIPA